MNNFNKLIIRNKNDLKILNSLKWFSSYDNDLNRQSKALHIPVMLDEIIKHIVEETKGYKVYLDMTFGAGGHTKAILEKNPNSVIYTLDRDPFAFDLATKLSMEYPERVIPLRGKFSEIGRLLSEKNLKEEIIDAALIDCGASSIQFDTAERGFSISRDGPLDMRMGSLMDSDTVTAADVVNKLDEESLGKIIWKYGEERLYKKIAHSIVYFRSAHGPIKTTKQLADIIAATVTEYRSDSLNRPAHIATKTFQALRIFVNNELNELYNGISEVHRFIKPGGRLAVISFHSLEDRIVKSFLNDVNINFDGYKKLELDGIENEKSNKSKAKYKTRRAKKNDDFLDKFLLNKPSDDFLEFNNLVRHLWSPLNKKVILPSDEEIERNPRSRSAKLRIGVRN